MYTICEKFHENTQYLLLAQSSVAVPTEILFIAAIFWQRKVSVPDILLAATAILDLLTLLPYTLNEMIFGHLHHFSSFEESFVYIVIMLWCVTVNAISHYMITLLAVYRIYRIRYAVNRNNNHHPRESAATFYTITITSVLIALMCVPMYINTIIERKCLRGYLTGMGQYNTITITSVLIALMCVPMYINTIIERKCLRGYLTDTLTCNGSFIYKTKFRLPTLGRINFYMSGIVFKLIPCIAVTIATGYSVREIMKHRRHRRSMKSNNTSKNELTVQRRSSGEIVILLDPWSKRIAEIQNHTFRQPPSFFRRFCGFFTPVTSGRSKLLLIVMVVFLASQLPICIISLTASLDETIWKLYHKCGKMLDTATMLTGLVYFFVYCLVNSQFQVALKSLLMCRQKDSVEEDNTSYTSLRRSNSAPASSSRLRIDLHRRGEQPEMIRSIPQGAPATRANQRAAAYQYVATRYASATTATASQGAVTTTISSQNTARQRNMLHRDNTSKAGVATTSKAGVADLVLHTQYMTRSISMNMRSDLNVDT